MSENKQSYFILIKGTRHQEEIAIVNFYAPNVVALNFIKHILLDLKTQIDHNAVIVTDFNSPLSPIDRTS
jgi:hypothetical protein